MSKLARAKGQRGLFLRPFPAPDDPPFPGKEAEMPDDNILIFRRSQPKPPAEVYISLSTFKRFLKQVFSRAELTEIGRRMDRFLARDATIEPWRWVIAITTVATLALSGCASQQLAVPAGADPRVAGACQAGEAV
jgi:hypothetical protein